ncbi:hypothetical protein ACIRVF_08105 [Kitasatospora sp. NPDC101157]|uniref:hypothetical protein n=1 Tax=Kitasatospora sp. NPDC101157 TaxID=3364098 RepID=UPI0037FE5034
MRLRQAHALITTSAELEAAGIGIEMHPFDAEAPHTIPDHMTGSVEYNDPDNPTRDTRTYNIDVYPGPTDDEIGVYVSFGLGVGGSPVLDRTFEALSKAEDADSYDHGTSDIASLVVAAIREHEKPFEAAYEARTGKGRSACDGQGVAIRPAEEQP